MLLTEYNLISMHIEVSGKTILMFKIYIYVYIANFDSSRNSRSTALMAVDGNKKEKSLSVPTGG